MRPRVAAGVVVVVLAAAALYLPRLRRTLIFDVTWWDAEPTEPAPLPVAPPDAAPASGLTPTPRTRVVLIDGLDATVAPFLARWSAVCRRGLTLTVDVGF